MKEALAHIRAVIRRVRSNEQFDLFIGLRRKEIEGRRRPY